jgi:hypothetical protein
MLSEGRQERDRLANLSIGIDKDERERRGCRMGRRRRAERVGNRSTSTSQSVTRADVTHWTRRDSLDWVH